MIRPVQRKTFAHYAAKIFMPYITSHFSQVTRLDLVWDQYLPDSLLSAARAKRRSGVRLHVMPSGSLLRNWSEFIHNDDNKPELFHFLSSYVASIELNDSKQLVVTDGPNQ